MNRREALGVMGASTLVFATGTASRARSEVREKTVVVFKLENGNFFSLPLELANKSDEQRSFRVVKFVPSVNCRIIDVEIYFGNDVIVRQPVNTYMSVGDEFRWTYSLKMSRNDQLKVELFKSF